MPSTARWTGLTLAASLCSLLAFAAVAAGSPEAGPLGLPLPTTERDFLQPGTQPETLSDPIFTSTDCRDCHGDYDASVEPYARWAGSMMGQASRDPIFYACLAIANQDVAGAGELCLRCHLAVGWLGGRSSPPDGSALDESKGDFDGVTCHFCHRLVDPVYDPAENPVEDAGILADLTNPPASEPHTGQYVVDPIDRRRGPFDLGFGFPWHNWRQSPFHREALLCSNCHDVSNPAMSREPDGSYKLNELDEPHPTHRKSDEFPIERTYTEWKNSVFAQADIDVGGRFGGNKPAVSICQDCHMPDASGVACKPGVGGTERDDLPLHDFNGANSWVLRAVRALYPDEKTGLTDQIVDDALARNHSMLQRAADLQLMRRDDDVVVRVINRSGHKLPTGYGEGRRMWLNLQFLDGAGQMLAEHGHYDMASAELSTDDTRVYEIHQGLDAYMAGVTGLPEGESFHFVLNNTTLKDNRIPPRGFTNAAFEKGQADVVDHSYPDQHYWDDAVFAIEPGTATVRVSLFHQTTSREYIEFLRDENETNDAGQVAYDLWEQLGQSAPVLMSTAELAVDTPVCVTPIVYGLGKLDASGTWPLLGWNGEPSVSQGDFEITLARAPAGQRAALVVGRQSASKLFRGAPLLVGEPDLITSVTVGPDGTASFQVPLQGNPGLVGTELYFQVLLADPSDQEKIGTSDALHVDVCE